MQDGSTQSIKEKASETDPDKYMCLVKWLSRKKERPTTRYMFFST